MWLVYTWESSSATRVMRASLCHSLPMACPLRSARKTARQSGAARARFRAGAAETVLGELVKEEKRYRTVVLDPPRTGAPELAEHLDSLGIERIVSVSCHAASFARDLKSWREKGFVLQSLQIHDLFPQTHHSEVLALLTREA